MSWELREAVARAICYANCIKAHPGDIDRATTQAENGWDLWLNEADAILPIIAAREAAVVERCIAAVESERLDDPQPGTSDEAYEQALTDAVAAIRSRGEGEVK